MKCASATAGIASVVTGLAVVLSSAPAHSTFLYLNQSQLISAAISASGVATSSGASPAAIFDAHYGEDVSVAKDTERSDADPANVPIMYAGIQRPVSAYGDVRDGDRDGSFSYGGFSWMSPRSASRVNNALPRHRAEARPVSNSPGATSPSKDASTGSGSVTAPSAPAANPQAPTPSVSTPPVATPSVPDVVSPPGNSSPIVSPPTPETPIVGLPSRSVPEPSTVGLLGIGLLLAFVGLTRGKRRARYYSPRSSRTMSSLARSLSQDGLHKA